MDCTKSPRIAKKHVKIQSITINIVPKSLMYDEIKNPYKIEKIIEATAPSTVFFGDRDSNSFVFP